MTTTFKTEISSVAAPLVRELDLGVCRLEDTVLHGPYGSTRMNTLALRGPYGAPRMNTLTVRGPYGSLRMNQLTARTVRA